MSLPTMTGTGRLTEDPDIRFSPNGTAVCKVNLAFNSRKRDDAGNWVDGDVFYVRGTAFKQLAENMGESLSRGDEVQVSGRLRTEKWQDKQTGENRSAVTLLIDSVGTSLAWATARPAKVERNGGGAAPGFGERRPTGPVMDDPWGAQPQQQPQDNEIPF
jgi:single-strand DNA-binding protein